MGKLTYYNPKRGHTVELEEHQTVQQDALERIGYRLVTGEGDGEAEEVALLEKSIPELEEALADIEDIDELMDLYEAEEDGRRRKGALEAIATRVHSLTESEDEADGDESPEEQDQEPEGGDADPEDTGETESEDEADGDDEG